MTEWLHFPFSFSCIGEGNGNPLQYFCLENPRDGGAWWAAVYGVAQTWTWLKRFSSSSVLQKDFPGGSAMKNPPANAGVTGDVSSTPGLGRSHRGGNSSPLQYSCLGNPMDGGAWWAAVHGVSKSWHNWMTKHVMSSRDSKKARGIVLRQHSAQALMLRNLLAGQMGDYLQTLRLMVSDLIPWQ